MDAANPKRILVVDDEKDVAEVLQYLLEDGGYEAVTAITVEEALIKAQEGGFAAALIDVTMGATSGLSLAQALRTLPATASMPIVILSGRAEQTVRDEFDGYDLFVSKGADLTDLVKKLDHLTHEPSAKVEVTGFVAPA